MKLKFGRYKGRDIADPDVPLSYLQWAEENIRWSHRDRQDLNFEIARRSGDRPGMGRTIREGQ